MITETPFEKNTVSLKTAPTPDLRIVPADTLIAHEDHDQGRLRPLVERLRDEAWMINPPIVAPLDDSRFVVLDGANRSHAFNALGIPHILVQVVDYDSGQVELSTWRHVVCQWDAEALFSILDALPIAIQPHGETGAPPSSNTIFMRLSDARRFILQSDDATTNINGVLRHLVHTYLTHAVLHRTVEPVEARVWELHPDATALFSFPDFTPDDVMRAARIGDHLPAGVSRHIVHGRAIRVNYPMAALRGTTQTIEAKNDDLAAWMHEKLAKRQIRYYAESTYQFDE